MKRDGATIREGIAQIFRNAQDRSSASRGSRPITRQLTTYLNEVFGNDAEGCPGSIASSSPSCKGLPAPTP